MKSAKRIIENKMNSLALTKEQLLERLTNNVVYELPWVMEDLYKASLRLDYIKAINQDIEDGIDAKKVMEHYLKVCKDFLGRKYNVFESSTSTAHRDASIWKYQTMFDLVEDINYLLDAVESETIEKRYWLMGDLEKLFNRSGSAIRF